MSSFLGVRWGLKITAGFDNRVFICWLARFSSGFLCNAAFVVQGVLSVGTRWVYFALLLSLESIFLLLLSLFCVRNVARYRGLVPLYRFFVACCVVPCAAAL